MAYAAVASLLQTIDIVLNYHQHSISPQLKDLIIPLQNHTLSLQTFFEDFPHKTYIWEEIIREATEMAEHIIELLLSDSLLKSTDRSSSKSKVEKGKYQLPYGITELQRVTTEIESIVGELKGESCSEAMDGPDDELMDIIYLLRGGSSDLRKIAIYGEEGVGKTTLAINAYNHPLIVDHFEVRAWTKVSSEYDRQQMIGELLRSMGAEPESVSSNTEDELIQSLYEKLRGKRYLLVLDAVSDLHAFALRRTKMMLPGDDNGSRVIVTTTNYTSVKIADNFHRMRFMSEDKAWNLLKEKIFEGDTCPSQLESVGKMIAASFRWRSASIKVISGILAANQTEAAWEDVLENINIASQNGNISDTRISRMLSLGYTYLPYYLRACFLYLACFREYEEIRVSKLVKLWVAEGFLNESECRSFEETGEEHVEDLVRRNLVRVGRRKSNDRIKTIRVQTDVMDVCLRQARIDNFVLSRFDKHPLSMNPQSCRRVSAFTHGDDLLKDVYGLTVRTIMLYGHGPPHSRWCVGNATLLRILDLSCAYNRDFSNVYYYELPEEVFDLFHLRYLAFHCGFSISEAISNLENLQTLIICPRENDGNFANLPEGIWRMPQLRHLLLFRFKFPSHNGATSPLENLQTLSGVVDFMCSRGNLKVISTLKDLALFYTKSFRECELHNLIYLQKLEILKIEMDWSFGGLHKMSWAFPPTLRKLNLCGLRLPWENMSIVASLPNLEVLKLRKLACMGKTWETSEGGFTQLTYLLIMESNLEHRIIEASHFPRLERLVLLDCWCLNEVPYDIVKIPTLESIKVDGENQSLLRSAKRIQEDRQSLGYDPLLIWVGYLSNYG